MLISVGQVEDRLAEIRNDKLNKKCFALPSTVVHTKAYVQSYRRNCPSHSGKWFFWPGFDDIRIELRFSYLNLFFIRFWLEWSLGIDASRFVTWNRETNDWEAYGKSVPACDLYGLYKSRCTAFTPNLRPFWIYNKCPVTKMPSGKPLKPGYWKVKVNPEQMQDHVLTMHRWNCSYTFKKDALYFSNTLAASVGLPPNAEHLGLPKIEMVLNPGNFGGLAIPRDYSVSKGRKWFKKDLICYIVNHYKLENSRLAVVSNALGTVVDELSDAQIINLEYFFAKNVGDLEFDSFILSVDSYVRILIEQSVV